MKWGGFQPFSLSDFPGCVAAIGFTKGCNLNCVYCHNRHLIENCDNDNVDDSVVDDSVNDNVHGPSNRITTDYILSVLKKRRRQLDGFVITGGEPTCQKDLVSFATEVKAMGYQIKLDTNGTAPATLDVLLTEKLVDYVAMDVKAPWYRYAQVTGVDMDTVPVRQSVALLADAHVPFEYRVTAVSPLLQAEDLLEIGMEIGPLGPVYLQSFHAPDSVAQCDSMKTLSTTPGLQQVARRLRNRFETVYVR